MEITKIPPLAEIYKADTEYFEMFPGAECGTRLPHPEEWPVPYGMVFDMIVIVKKEAPGIRSRFLMHVPGSWEDLSI